MPADLRAAADRKSATRSTGGSPPAAEKNKADLSAPRADQADTSESDRSRLARDKRSGRVGLVTRASESGAPAAATSHYLRTAREETIQGLGCRQGRAMKAVRGVPDAIVVLAFGRPQRRHGRWGASLFGHRFLSTEGVERAGRAYARGYLRCSTGTPTRIEIALGTSNYGGAVTHAHGKAWAEMVNGANDWVEENGLRPKVRFAGASDIELGWNGPGVSRRWVRGYDSVARWRFYNFGDAAACQPRGDCLGAWTQEDVWFVSWGALSAWPLPQIYNESGIMAEQWYRLSLYAYSNHGAPMTIVGSLSQRAACRQSSDPCWGINNSPQRAWGQLQRWLNSDPRTAQDLRWISDLRWEG
jgi:hypothetical protein